MKNQRQREVEYVAEGIQLERGVLAFEPVPRADAHSFPAILPHCSLLVHRKLEVTYCLIGLCQCYSFDWL